eukprot:augustus_masked-scaffold_12-processed-gene-0.8-mRNA-1 protein AED:1.00 eAED:1.00 QI:0/-1/0/0/-1/1/1/0/580
MNQVQTEAAVEEQVVPYNICDILLSLFKFKDREDLIIKIIERDLSAASIQENPVVFFKEFVQNIPFFTQLLVHYDHKWQKDPLHKFLFEVLLPAVPTQKTYAPNFIFLRLFLELSLVIFDAYKQSNLEIFQRSAELRLLLISHVSNVAVVNNIQPFQSVLIKDKKEHVYDLKSGLFYCTHLETKQILFYLDFVSENISVNFPNGYEDEEKSKEFSLGDLTVKAHNKTLKKRWVKNIESTLESIEKLDELFLKKIRLLLLVANHKTGSSTSRLAKNTGFDPFETNLRTLGSFNEATALKTGHYMTNVYQFSRGQLVAKDIDHRQERLQRLILEQLRFGLQTPEILIIPSTKKDCLVSFTDVIPHAQSLEGIRRHYLRQDPPEEVSLLEHFRRIIPNDNEFVPLQHDLAVQLANYLVAWYLFDLRGEVSFDDNVLVHEEGKIVFLSLVPGFSNVKAKKAKFSKELIDVLSFTAETQITAGNVGVKNAIDILGTQCVIKFKDIRLSEINVEFMIKLSDLGVTEKKKTLKSVEKFIQEYSTKVKRGNEKVESTGMKKFLTCAESICGKKRVPLYKNYSKGKYDY